MLAAAESPCLGMAATGSDVAWFIVGLVVVLLTARNVIRVLIIPRPARAWVASATMRVFVGPTRLVTRRIRNYERRDRILTWQGPLQIVAMALAWLGLFLFGYGAMIAGDGNVNLAEGLRESGSSLFTLGFASGDRAPLTLIDFIAAATGPMLIGLLIGYLPTMYTAYNARELEVTILRSRAGEPNWGPGLLARAAATDALDQLPTFWLTWERWAANVWESHSSYPILVQTRSARPYRSWVIALLAVMDAAALSLSLRPEDRQGTARVLIRQGTECLTGLAEVSRLEVPPAGPDAGIVLSHEEFCEAVDAMEAAGYRTQRRARDAWPHFCQWRSRYEPAAYALARHLDVVPAPWSGGRTPETPVIWPERFEFLPPD